ncbi:MAG TPA: isoprenylcysteine carboxylmethyltransferase family protein [Terriglobia bacterium]|nr:isoprenylcysteine carboxylmethyltransferase family protein [Terriglobia bacterium]
MKLVGWIDVPLFLGFGIFVLYEWQHNIRYFLGLGEALVSFILWMVARRQLGASFSVRPQARALVTRGLYSKVRHPIYLFAGLAFAGLFVAWGRPVGLVYFAVILPVQLLRMKYEEAVLDAAFGEEYRRYKATTWF